MWPQFFCWVSIPERPEVQLLGEPQISLEAALLLWYTKYMLITEGVQTVTLHVRDLSLLFLGLCNRVLHRDSTHAEIYTYIHDKELIRANKYEG